MLSSEVLETAAAAEKKKTECKKRKRNHHHHHLLFQTRTFIYTFLASFRYHIRARVVCARARASVIYDRCHNLGLGMRFATTMRRTHRVLLVRLIGH